MCVSAFVLQTQPRKARVHLGATGWLWFSEVCSRDDPVRASISDHSRHRILNSVASPFRVALLCAEHIVNSVSKTHARDRWRA